MIFGYWAIFTGAISLLGFTYILYESLKEPPVEGESSEVDAEA